MIEQPIDKKGVLMLFKTIKLISNCALILIIILTIVIFDLDKNSILFSNLSVTVYDIKILILSFWIEFSLLYLVL